MASKVLPQPALPYTSVVRPFGRPPPVTSSNPSIPVGVFGSGLRDSFNLAWSIAAAETDSLRSGCQHILTKRRAAFDGCAGGRREGKDVKQAQRYSRKEAEAVWADDTA